MDWLRGTLEDIAQRYSSGSEQVAYELQMRGVNVVEFLDFLKIAKINPVDRRLYDFYRPTAEQIISAHRDPRRRL